MATGEGKSLLFMLPCILPDTRVTILVLPLVFLQGDLLRRVRELGIDYLVWSPSEQRDTPLVFVMVEAIYTK
jgi:superfamily II DNA helicase RecQ